MFPALRGTGPTATEKERVKLTLLSLVTNLCRLSSVGKGGPPEMGQKKCLGFVTVCGG